MAVTEGDKFRSLLTDRGYFVKSRSDYSVVLESEDGLSQILTHEGNLDLFYEKIGTNFRVED